MSTSCRRVSCRPHGKAALLLQLATTQVHSHSSHRTESLLPLPLTPPPLETTLKPYLLRALWKQTTLEGSSSRCSRGRRGNQSSSVDRSDLSNRPHSKPSPPASQIFPASFNFPPLLIDQLFVLCKNRAASVLAYQLPVAEGQLCPSSFPQWPPPTAAKPVAAWDSDASTESRSNDGAPVLKRRSASSDRCPSSMIGAGGRHACSHLSIPQHFQRQSRCI